MKKQIIRFSRGEKITIENAKDFIGCFIITDDADKFSISWLDGITDDNWLIDNQGYEYESAHVAVPVYKKDSNVIRCAELINVILDPNKKAMSNE